MLFFLGYLVLDDEIIIGDPCYFDDPSPSVLQTKINPPQKRTRYAVFTDMQKSIYGGDPKPGSLILWYKNDGENCFDWPSNYQISRASLKPEGLPCGVDSGQISFINPDVMETWTEKPNVHPIPKTAAETTNDYDAVSQVTVYSQLGGGVSPKHVLDSVYDGQRQVSKIITSATYDGDGSYQVYRINNSLGQEQGLLIDFRNKNDEDDSDDRYDDNDDD